MPKAKKARRRNLPTLRNPVSDKTPCVEPKRAEPSNVTWEKRRKPIERSSYSVSVFHHLLDRNVDRVLASYARRYKGKSLGAGLAFMSLLRDNEFEFNSAKLAKIFCEKVQEDPVTSERLVKITVCLTMSMLFMKSIWLKDKKAKGK